MTPEVPSFASPRPLPILDSLGGRGKEARVTACLAVCQVVLTVAGVCAGRWFLDKRDVVSLVCVVQEALSGLGVPQRETTGLLAIAPSTFDVLNI